MRTLVFLLCCWGGPALACSCARSTLDRAVVPPDGATAVPVDAIVRVFVTGGMPSQVREHLGQEYRLVGPGGPVELRASAVRTRIDLKPQRRLKARAEYRLEQLYAYADGALLGDVDRLRLAGQGRAADARRWYPVARFTTSGGVGKKPKMVAFERPKVGFRRGGGDCGPGTSLNVKVTGTGGPLDILELRVEGHGVVETRPAGPGWLGVSDLMCDPDPYRLGVKGPFVTRVAVVGPNGASVVSKPATADVLLAPFPRRRLRPLPPTGLPADPHWFAGPIKGSPAPSASGPAGCRHGLEVVADAQVADAGSPMMWDHRAAPIPVGAVVGAGVIRDGAAVVASGYGTTRIHAPATSIRGAPAGRGTAVVVGDHQDAHAALTVVLLDADGEPRWVKEIARERTNWHAKVAACGDRVFASWSQVVEDDYNGARLQWTVHDAKDGRVIARSSAQTSVDGEYEGSALGCAGDGSAWLVSRPKDRFEKRVQVHRITPAGEVAPVEFPARTRRGNYAVAPTGEGAVVVDDNEGVRVWGDPKAPLVVATHGQKPALINVGAHYVLSWEDRLDGALYATALDLEGRVAQPIPLGRGYRNAGWRADPLGVAVSVDGAARVLRLRCAESPTSGPPRRIEESKP